MSHSFTPVDIALTTLTLPEDGDPEVAASVNLPFEQLGDAIKHVINHSADAGVSSVGGRLTVSSLIPVPQNDATAQSTLFWTPYHGGHISIFDGTNWFTRLTDEISIA